jgi:hypothetical protein
MKLHAPKIRALVWFYPPPSPELRKGKNNIPQPFPNGISGAFIRKIIQFFCGERAARGIGHAWFDPGFQAEVTHVASPKNNGPTMIPLPEPSFSKTNLLNKQPLKPSFSVKPMGFSAFSKVSAVF